MNQLRVHQVGSGALHIKRMTSHESLAGLPD
jgi:hypothetical protein